MKRILLLIVLVMLATWAFRVSEHRMRTRHKRDWVEAPRWNRKADPKPHRLAIAEKIDDEGAERVEVEVEAKTPAPVDTPTRKVSSQLMATEDRARIDAIRRFEEELSAWLEPEVPTDWKAPAPLVKSLIKKTTFTPVVKDYGTLYIAELTADTSPKRREAILKAYHRETTHHRMMAMGGALAFTLACLGAISFYIRADEATKGYYTNRLRMLAAAGIGAAGMAVYRYVA